ncbi:MAG: hypothetical protein ACRDYY_13515 [Acidimicrobiales bacterium]
MALGAHTRLRRGGAERGCLRLLEPLADVFLDATGGDDFIGVQTYTRMLIGPDGWVGPEPAVEVLPMSYEYWPAALEACLRRAWRARTPCSSAANGSGVSAGVLPWEPSGVR